MQGEKQADGNARALHKRIHADREDITLTKEYPGYLSSQLKVDLVARVNGYLRTSYLKAGSRVKKGDLIFVIEPDTYQDNVTQAEASVKTSKPSWNMHAAITSV